MEKTKVAYQLMLIAEQNIQIYSVIWL